MNRVAVALLAFVTLVAAPPPASAQRSPSALRSPFTIAWPKAELVGHRDERIVVAADLAGRDALTIISFTWLGCTTICPTSDRVVMSDLDRTLPPGTRLYTITLDPLSDTPRRLRSHAGALEASARWTFLTGDARVVFDLLDRFGIAFGRIDEHPPAYFVVRNGRGERIEGLASSEDLRRVAARLEP